MIFSRYSKVHSYFLPSRSFFSCIDISFWCMWIVRNWKWNYSPKFTQWLCCTWGTYIDKVEAYHRYINVYAFLICLLLPRFPLAWDATIYATFNNFILNFHKIHKNASMYSSTCLTLCSFCVLEELYMLKWHCFFSAMLRFMNALFAFCLSSCPQCWENALFQSHNWHPSGKKFVQSLKLCTQKLLKHLKKLFAIPSEKFNFS